MASQLYIRKSTYADELPCIHSNDDVLVTNPNVTLQGLGLYNNFVSVEEEANILAGLENAGTLKTQEMLMEENFKDGLSKGSSWKRDCFSQRRRQIHKRVESNLSRAFNDRFDNQWGWLIDRIYRLILKREDKRIINYIQVDEISGCNPSGPNNLEDCYDIQSDVVLELHLGAKPGVLVSFRKPVERRNDCWELEDATKVFVPQRSLVVKSGDCLRNWRQNVSTGNKNTLIWKLPAVSDTIDLRRDTSFQHICIKFRHFCPEMKFMPFTKLQPSSLEEISREEIPETQKLSDRLTIIVTTSPIKSNPSTEMIKQTFETFLFAGEEFAHRCRKIIVCDGFRENESKVTKKHANFKQAMRNGIVNPEQASNYQLFKRKLHQLTQNNENPTFNNTTILELEERHGYGFALKEAIKLVSTPFVCVIQHDRTFMRRTPVENIVEAMVADSRIKYVGCSMRSNLMYRDIFMSKYGKQSLDELLKLCIHPLHLRLPGSLYGPDGSSVSDMILPSEKLRSNISALKQTYFGSSQFLSHKPEGLVDNEVQLSLTPTLFWYDNTHICETKHYRNFIFDPRLKMVKRGGFVEDKLSPNILKSVERVGLQHGHSRFGCYLVDDHSGTFFVGHLDGGSFLTVDEKQKLLKKK